MFTLKRKIYTSVNIFFDIEYCKKPKEDILTDRQENSVKFENEFNKKDGSILNAFGKMMTNFIGSKDINDISQQKKIENIKHLSIGKAETILNNPDPNITPEEKRKALEGLFQSFKENKDAFPDNQNKENTSQNEFEDKSEKFLKELMKVIGENRIDSEKINCNFAREISKKSACPANGGGDVPASPLCKWP